MKGLKILIITTVTEKIINIITATEREFTSKSTGDKLRIIS